MQNMLESSKSQHMIFPPKDVAKYAFVLDRPNGKQLQLPVPDDCHIGRLSSLFRCCDEG